MKKLLPIFLLFLGACTPEQEVPDPALAPTRLTERRYLSASAQLISSDYFQYDSDGRIIETRTLNLSGEVENRIAYRWVDDNLRRTETYYTNPPWSSSMQKGLPLKLYSVTVTEFGTGSRPVSARNYTINDGKEDFRSTTRYVYDSQNRLSRKEILDPGGTLTSYTTYEYDVRANTLTEKFFTNTFGEKDKLNFTNTYEFDDRPNPYRTAGLSGIVWYDSPHNIIRQTSVNAISSQQSDSRYSYAYRPDGYPSQMLYADGRKEEFVYNR